MYTDQMRRAFHSVRVPQGFSGVELVDNEHFLSIRLEEKSFAALSEEDKRRAIEYVFKIKAALEDNGAVVLVVRKALGEKND
jgi:hypothetical protein